MNEVNPGAPFEPKPEGELQTSVTIVEFKEERIAPVSVRRIHRKRHYLHWPNFRGPSIIVLVTVLAVATVMLPFLVWVIAPLLLLGAAVSAWKARAR